MTGIGMGDGTNFAAREGGNMPAKHAAHGYPAAATAGYGK
jgi:hypothetical protein